MMSEQSIQRAIIKHLEKEGAYCVKVITANKAGVADIVCCYRGLWVSLEVKTPKGIVAPLQEYHQELVRKAGGIAGIVRSVDDVKSLLSDLEA